MAREWFATCKDCGEKFGYSDTSLALSNLRGLSRPERCPKCRKLHSREIANLGLTHFELTPVRPIPSDGLSPGVLGGLERARPLTHEAHESQPSFDLEKFAIKDKHIREFFDVLLTHQITVIVAPTGSGKSTFLPYRLMVPPSGLPQDLLSRQGQIIVTQPRIQATRNIPLFVARDLHGSSLGAGFDVGFRHSGSPATDWRNKLVYLTDGTLINMIVRNELGKLSVIMIDEAHERSLNIDLILGLLKAQLPRYPHLRLIIASATIDTKSFIGFYGGPEGFNPDDYKIKPKDPRDGDSYDNDKIAKALQDSPVGFYGFPGKRQHPVEVTYREEAPIPEAQMPGRMPDEVALKVVEILEAMGGAKSGKRKDKSKNQPNLPLGDILAFLHGEKPIERAVERIREMVEEKGLGGKVDVFPLYTKLPQSMQDAALKPKQHKDKWRVVVSTNVAETSLTVEGIVHVVDSGLINESQWDPKTQTEFVVPKTHSQAGCRQRWGRAGRVQPGVAHCLYTKEQFEHFIPHTLPEITRAPLEQIVLAAKAAGVDDIKTFPWIQRPSEAELNRAPVVLRQIGALDRDGDLTDHGLELRSFTEEIDIANLMILADRFGCAVEVATLIPMLKLDGYRSLFLWDKAWDASTKRAVHRIQQGILGPCQDDLEFYLKLWEAWEGRRYGWNNEKREEWARHFFVNHTAFRTKVAPDREALLDSLSGHKKETSARPIDFNLLTRLRIVMTYALSNQIYELSNAAADSTCIIDEPMYRPYISNPEENPELVQLHADARVEISEESVCHGRILQCFVSAKRQRVRIRRSPLIDPESRIITSFLTLIRPEWRKCAGQSPVSVARLIARETRTSDGKLIATTNKARLFIDQRYPIGATFECHTVNGSDEDVSIGTRVSPPPQLGVGRSNEDVETPEDVEVLESEGVLAGTMEKEDQEGNKQVSHAPTEEEETPIWIDMLEEQEERHPLSNKVSGQERSERSMMGKLVRLPQNASIQEKFNAVVVGYELSNLEKPWVKLEIPSKPDPFDLFKTAYTIGSRDIDVEVVGVEHFINDRLAYLVVREVKAKTNLEIVMDPYDASLLGRNFAIEMLKPGDGFTVTLEEWDLKARRVRVTRLREAESAMPQFLKEATKRIVDATIVEVRDNGLHLWLDPASTQNSMPYGAFVHLNRLPERPEEMSLGKICKVSVRPRNWSRELRRSVSSKNGVLEKALLKYHWTRDLNWDEPTGMIVVAKRITYDERTELLELSEDSEYRRTINLLFRRSNELDVRVLDITGTEYLLPFQTSGQLLEAKVVRVLDDRIFVSLPDGSEWPVEKDQVVFDQSRSLEEAISEGDAVDVTVQTVDPTTGYAKLSLLRQEDWPGNKYKVGQEVKGRITSILDYGVRIELVPGAQGLVRTQDLTWKEVKRPSDVVQHGQRVHVRITAINPVKRQIDLTMRFEKSDPLKKLKVDQRIFGRVVGFTDDGAGAFVNLVPGVNGFLYRDEIKFDPIQDIKEILSEEQKIKVRITEIDRDKRKVRVTMRGLFEATLQVPSTHARLIIGKDGSTVKEIMGTTKTYIRLREDGECIVQGMTAKHVQAAVQRLKSILATRSVSFAIEERQRGMLIGQGGQTIRRLQSIDGVHLDLSGQSVTLTSENDRVLKKVLKEIESAISYHELLIEVPASLIGRVIGIGGKNIQRIQSECGVHIKVLDGDLGRISVEGKKRTDTQEALRQIEEQTGKVELIESTQKGLPKGLGAKPKVAHKGITKKATARKGAPQKKSKRKAN